VTQYSTIYDKIYQTRLLSLSEYIFLFLIFLSNMAEQQAKKSLISRPLDLIYFIYFASHIPVTLAIDLQVFFPPQWIPQVLKDALTFYIETYKDPFMGSSTPAYWFLSFVACELFIQLPFFFMACMSLIKGIYS
jgi:hypothetical protein